MPVIEFIMAKLLAVTAGYSSKYDREHFFSIIGFNYDFGNFDRDFVVSMMLVEVKIFPFFSELIVSANFCKSC